MSKVWVFFYGTFMTAKVLQQAGINCKKTYPAKLSGYHLEIQPRVNLIKNNKSISYGGLAFVEQKQLNKLYKKVHKTYGQIYYPYPVLAKLEDGKTKIALCYISKRFKCGHAEPEYLNEMIKCARKMHASKSYIKHIKSFKK